MSNDDKTNDTSSSYLDADGNAIKNDTFYRIKDGDNYKVIFVGNLDQAGISELQRLAKNAFLDYVPINSPAEYAQELSDEANRLNRAARGIRNRNNLEIETQNITLEMFWD